MLSRTPQPTPQQKCTRPILVFTNRDPHLVTEALRRRGHSATIEFRQIPDSIVNATVYARVMALRVAKYGRKVVMDWHLHGVDVLTVSSMIPDHRRHDIIALSPDPGSHLSIATVQVPDLIPI